MALAAALVGIGVAVCADDASTTLPDAGQITRFLDQTISWAHLRAEQQRIATDPGDLLELADTRQMDDQIVRLSFDFARAAAVPISQQSSAINVAGESSEYRSLAQLQSKLNAQIQDTQQELEADRRKLSTSAGRERSIWQSKVSELQGELDLANARRDAVNSMLDFVGGQSANGVGGSGLRAQIETLAGSLAATSTTGANAGNAPSTAAAASATTTAAAAAANANRGDTSGIWNSAAGVYALASKVRQINGWLVRTQAFEQASKDIRAPFVAQLKALSQRGDQLGGAADATTINAAQLAQERAQLDALAAQFKQFSAAVIPLVKQTVMLDLYQKSLGSWRESVRDEYHVELRALGVRLLVLVLILGVVVAAAELWRRAVIRYVHEPRRRYQLLLVRRFVLWFLIAIVIALAFSSRLDSVVTFAGLITAGVAVALQNVILAIVGYFFLIGKYGIRVGDRVQIGEVVGEVIDVGLVRMYLMELGGGGGTGPTGRVVAFSNAIVFQASSGLFKQMPGLSFAWHEITLTLAAVEDFAVIRTRLLQAVQRVLEKYKDEIERQNREIERTVMSISGDSLKPRVQLRFVAAGIEATVRYPVDIRHASEIDERVSQELLRELEQEPKFKLAGSGLPDMRFRTDFKGA